MTRTGNNQQHDTADGKNSVTTRTSGSEKRHTTLVLTDAADAFILPPIIIFKG